MKNLKSSAPQKRARATPRVCLRLSDQEIHGTYSSIYKEKTDLGRELLSVADAMANFTTVRARKCFKELFSGKLQRLFCSGGCLIDPPTDAEEPLIIRPLGHIPRGELKVEFLGGCSYVCEFSNSPGGNLEWLDTLHVNSKVLLVATPCTCTEAEATREHIGVVQRLGGYSITISWLKYEFVMVIDIVTILETKNSLSDASVKITLCKAPLNIETLPV